MLILLQIKMDTWVANSWRASDLLFIYAFVIYLLWISRLRCSICFCFFFLWDFTFSIFQLSCLKDKEAKSLPVHTQWMRNTASSVFLPFSQPSQQCQCPLYCQRSLFFSASDVNKPVALVWNRHPKTRISYPPFIANGHLGEKAVFIFRAAIWPVIIGGLLKGRRLSI